MLPLQDFLTPPPPTPTLPNAPAPQAAPLTTPLPTPLPVPTATPVPGAPTPVPAPGTTPVASGTANLAAVVALIIYLVFFGIIGYRRGATRELWVLAVSLALAFGLQFFSEQIVLLFDRFGKGIAFLTGQPIPEQSALGAWAAANTTTLLLLLWLGGVVVTYFLTNRLVRNSVSNGWAAVLGVFNGLVFATIFAPLLTSLIFPEATFEGPMIQLPVLTFVGNIWEQLTDLVVRIWNALGPAADTVLFLAIVFLVFLAAFTLRPGARAKPKS